MFVTHKTHKQAKDAIVQLIEELHDVKKDRFEYMQKNNNLSEFTLNLIKQYVPIEKQADLIENMDKFWKKENKIENEERKVNKNAATQPFSFVFEVDTVCNDSKLNANTIKDMAIGFNLKVISFKLSQKIPCAEVYSLMCHGTEEAFNNFKKNAKKSVSKTL